MNWIVLSVAITGAAKPDNSHYKGYFAASLITAAGFYEVFSNVDCYYGVSWKIAAPPKQFKYGQINS
jgi:hypothetical protein